MEIYFAQSLKCGYANLRDVDYKAYTYYDKGETLVAKHPQCTHSQITQGYAIEFTVLAIITAFMVGVYQRREADKSRIFGLAVSAALMALIGMAILNGVTMAFPIVATLAISITVLATCVWMGSRTTNPLEIWRQYQAEKERLAQKRLRDAQAEINRLRSSDPQLNEALKSLDAMTTALYD